jgi:hypothetical protein
MNRAWIGFGKVTVLSWSFAGKLPLATGAPQVFAAIACGEGPVFDPAVAIIVLARQGGEAAQLGGRFELLVGNRFFDPIRPVPTGEGHNPFRVAFRHLALRPWLFARLFHPSPSASQPPLHPLDAAAGKKSCFSAKSWGQYGKPSPHPPVQVRGHAQGES